MTTNTTNSMILSLTEGTEEHNTTTSASSSSLTDLVGGKAASLMKLYSITPPPPADGSSSSTKHHYVPRGFALTVDFFREWMDAIRNSPEWKQESLSPDNDIGLNDVMERCNLIKEYATKLPLSTEQSAVLDQLKKQMSTWSSSSAAVRSSAPEEDGGSASFAGVFETKLGVTPEGLEEAVRECFASRFDYRVFSYTDQNATSRRQSLEDGSLLLFPTTGFACVVMEMVDSLVAGVAFSVNPLNSDLDELVIDSSWGLGESVVDGSVEVDHYVYNKVDHGLIEKNIGSKKQEKRLTDNGKGVQVRSVDEARQAQSSLSDGQLKELADLVCLVEKSYGLPMDVEWAYTSDGELKLLQARPITTNFVLDDNMITAPGERRVLFWDYNIASDATTTTPFTHMDITQYSKMSSVLMGCPNLNLFRSDPRLPMFNASTRQYCNLSLFLRYFSPEHFSKKSEMLDPYLASLLASKDCDRERYRIRRWKDPWPKEVNLWNGIWLMRQFPWCAIYKTNRKFTKNPEKSKKEYMRIVQEDLSRLDQIHERGVQKELGLQKHMEELFEAIKPSLDVEMSLLFFSLLPLFGKLDKKRREGKTEGIRQEYDALCGGYEGDELMEKNIAMYRLARMLPESVWLEYDYGNFDQLAERIQENLSGKKSDLPKAFLDEWAIFLSKYGYDGQDQLFMSSPRYIDSPEVLLAKMRHNVGDGIKDPAEAQRENAEKRRKVMALHEERARKAWCGLKPFAASKIRKRNELLEHFMWIRNAPKIHMSRVAGMFRQALLKTESNLLESGRLEQAGDIFHLDVEEIDRVIVKDESIDLMELVRPRKAIYDRALRTDLCPMLVDSRCRILRPDATEQEPGTIVGTPVSPGIASGRVRVVHHPTDPLEPGEVLVTTVTDPAWTPLFVGASAVVLQIGGILQHGALCCREYGKPAVSGIDVMAHLKTGMIVSVDGNTGIVKIIDEEEAKASCE